MDFINQNAVVEGQKDSRNELLRMLPVAANLEQHAYARGREQQDRAELERASRIVVGADGQPAAAPAQAPATAGVPAQAATPTPSPTAPPPQGPLSNVQANGDPTADRLRRAAGVGGRAAQVYTPLYLQHQERQRLAQDKHSDAVLSKLGDGDIEGARQYAKAHNLTHLDEMFQNPQALTTVSSVSKLAKNLGLRDTHASAFVSEVMEGMRSGKSYDESLRNAHQKVAQRADAEPTGAVIESASGLFQRSKGGKVVPVKDADGNVLMPTDRRATHRPATVTGDGASRQTAFAEAKKKALIAIGWSEKDATESAYNPQGQGKKPSEKDAATLAKSLWSSDQKQLLSKQRKFKSFDDAMVQARKSLGIEAAAAAPAAPEGEAPAAVPAAPAKGGAGAQPVSAPVKAAPEGKLSKYPAAPRDALQRKVGSTYNTPRGDLKWMGNGWAQPDDGAAQ